MAFVRRGGQKSLRLHFDTSVLGALTDPGAERPTVVARQLLRAVLGGVHTAVISNIVQEELGRAPAEIRRAILHEVREIEFELMTEGVESVRLFEKYLVELPALGQPQDAASGPCRERPPGLSTA